MASSLPYHDLLGTPYVRCGSSPGVGLDCFGVVQVMYARAGADDPVLVAGLDAFASRIALGGALKTASGPWVKLGTDLACARKLLDVVHTHVDREETGVAVLVSTSPQLFLTSVPGRGVIVRHARAFQGECGGVYRRRNAA